jgi:hypothetical protein
LLALIPTNASSFNPAFSLHEIFFTVAYLQTTL